MNWDPRTITPGERNYLANPDNLLELRQMYDRMLNSGESGDRLERAAGLLQTALWWHRDKLIPAYAQARLRIVKESK